MTLTDTVQATGAGASAIARRAMVDNQLRTNDVTEAALVLALRETPREPHLPAELQAAAYIDRALPLGGDRALNPPLTTARLIAEAQVQPGQSVLLIGAATGYAAALLARLGATVVAVEEDAGLMSRAQQTLTDVAAVRLVQAPLTAGAPGDAPFDVLIVDGAVAALPQALLAQLRPGARIACGIAGDAVTRLARAVALTDGQPVRPLAFADLECVILPGFAAPPRFSF